MKYGITTISVIPCRVEPSESAEQVTQLLFGETYRVLEERKKWIRISCSHDNYEAWIDRKLFDSCTESQVSSPMSFYTAELVSLVKHETEGSLTPIVLGSTVPPLKDSLFEMGNHRFQIYGEVNEAKFKGRDKLVELARMYLNAPYLWGGRGPFGIDCSGLSQVVYAMCGISLPRDAKDQANEGVTLSFIEEAEPGDLAFFDNEEGNIIHVGILLGDNYIIHASGKVRIDRIDHQGIYNPELRDYTHKLRIIKQLVN